MAIPRPRHDSTALVTGASSGIGAEAARQLAARGHNLVVVARREDRLRALATELRDAHGVQVDVLTCDLADAAARQRLVDEVGKLGREVTVLVNSAGYAHGGLFHRVDPAAHTPLVRTNLEALIELVAAFVGPMAKARSGAVLNVSSFVGFQPMPGIATYAATKAAGRAFSEALHAELAPRGVSVTALCPGPVRTEFIDVAGVEALVDSLPGFMWTSVEECVRVGLEDLDRGKPVSVPNLAVKLFAFASTHLPHRLTIGALTRRGRRGAAARRASRTA